jgi:hypothetical protein
MSALALILPLLSKALDFIPDPVQRAQSFSEILGALQQWDSEQNKVNAEEAKNPNIFVSGWRPFIGWGCGLAIWYQYLVIPFATWGFALYQVEIPPFPKLDNNMWELTFGMLGMGGLRTMEKLKGIK